MDIQGSALFSIGDSIFMDIHRGVLCSIGAAKRIPLWRYHRRCSLWWGAHFASFAELGFHGRRLLSPESFPKNWVVLGPKSSLCPTASMLVTVCRPLLFQCFFTHSFKKKTLVHKLNSPNFRYELKGCARISFDEIRLMISSNIAVDFVAPKSRSLS